MADFKTDDFETMDFGKFLGYSIQELMLLSRIRREMEKEKKDNTDQEKPTNQILKKCHKELVYLKISSVLEEFTCPILAKRTHKLMKRIRPKNVYIKDFTEILHKIL